MHSILYSNVIPEKNIEIKIADNCSITFLNFYNSTHNQYICQENGGVKRCHIIFKTVPE